MTNQKLEIPFQSIHISVGVADRREHYSHEELATVGELVLEVSRILART